jgi:hypothetical protein
MKKIVALIVSIQSAICIAAAGMPCEKIEYAELKDKTKEELKYEYCRAKDRTRLNEELYAIYRKEIDAGVFTSAGERERTESGDAASSCRRAAISALGMLEKKFKIKGHLCQGR